MKVTLRKVTVGELFDGYDNRGDDGVVGYGGALDIRPPFQREFVYATHQQQAVIDTINKGFPLNVMYWADDGNGKFEVIDGQQRTLSICEYLAGAFSVGNFYYHNLLDDAKQKILDYELTVYVCEGSDAEKLDWFRTINIAGVELSAQELRNAVYSGPWVIHAKRHFSSDGCSAEKDAKRYLRGHRNRQDWLETAISWASGDGNVEGFMAKHQHDRFADDLLFYFQKVLDWVETTFPNYRSNMKGIDWNALYREYSNDELDPVYLESEIKRLLEDEDVQRQSGIYAYLLSGEEKYLNLRSFPKQIKMRVYQRQEGQCNRCFKDFALAECEADHVQPWSEGGTTTEDNCQVLCRKCNRVKGAR